MDDGLGRVRRGDGNVGLADCLFGTFRHFDVYPEDGGHFLRERFAMRLVSTEASESPNGADRADRLQLALCLPSRADDPDRRSICTRETLSRDARARSRPLLST